MIPKGALRAGQSARFQGIESITWRCFDCWNPPQSLVPPGWPLAMAAELIDGMEGVELLKEADRARVIGRLTDHLRQSSAKQATQASGSRPAKRPRQGPPEGGAVDRADISVASAAATDPTPRPSPKDRWARSRQMGASKRNSRDSSTEATSPATTCHGSQPKKSSSPPACSASASVAAADIDFARPELVPASLWHALYPFQRQGVEFGLRVQGRVLIGDEMGLGKTLQGMTLACAYRSQWPCLILAPASMCLQWADELEKWLPWLLPADINLVLSRDNSRLETAPLSILSYGLMTSGKAKEALAQRIRDARFKVVVADVRRCNIAKSHSFDASCIHVAFALIPMDYYHHHHHHHHHHHARKLTTSRTKTQLGRRNCSLS